MALAHLSGNAHQCNEVYEIYKRIQIALALKQPRAFHLEISFRVVFCRHVPL